MPAGPPQPPDCSPELLAQIEQDTQEIGRQLFARLHEQRAHFWQRQYWEDRLMQWSMHDERVKTQLFRFVDVLPMLRTSREIIGHLDEYLGQVRERLPWSLRTGLFLARSVPPCGWLTAALARTGARDFARKFIAGATSREVLASAHSERRRGRAFTLDILGEAVISQSEAQQYFEAYLKLLDETAAEVNAWPAASILDQAQGRDLPRVNLSIKLSALDSQFDAIDPEGTTARVADRLRTLLRAASRHQAFINIDMESYEKKVLTLRIFRQVLSEDEFRRRTDVGIVVQCYLHDAPADLAALCDWAKQRGAPVWVRLVKGAYWDYETIHARQNGWAEPVLPEKWQSDANFERCTRFTMANYQHLRPALGSHNLRSLAHGIAAARRLGVPPDEYELQMLYGMGDAEKQALVELGLRLRIYMPYGQLIPGMAYLVRRLLENTANDSFLRASFVQHVPLEKLLAPPGPPVRAVPSEPASPRNALPSARGAAPMDSQLARFVNEPPVDFAREESRQAMLAALSAVRQQFGRHFPLVIGGQNVETEQRLASHDPSNFRQVVGTTALADRSHAPAALAAARRAQAAWQAKTPETRAEYLRAAAGEMRRTKFELAAWLVYEAGKPWREATADVAEAIDFCEYYAAGAIDLFASRGQEVPGESNRFEYIPRGVAAVVAPWNFPLAILTGMTVASLVTGNTVVMKPAEQTPLVAGLLQEIFARVNLPPGVLNYLPGPGETVGAALVEDPQTALIAFTGSRSVGLAINARAAATPGPRHVKRVIAEMGGKNALLVDRDADLDEAVLAVMHSAFGYGGQKCSACSRAIVLAPVYDAFLSRLVEATRSLKVGPAFDPATSVGPLIDREARDKVLSYLELGRREGRTLLATDVGPLAEQGYFVGPHIFADVSPAARIAQEEIFGPVLAVIRAADLDEAIRIASDTDYALTAGIFSRSPANLERARRELTAGNLYLNRGITGALVSRQPFGGHRLSGIGSQAGGPDYLFQFVLPRTITENTLRRGFAPHQTS